MFFAPYFLTKAVYRVKRTLCDMLSLYWIILIFGDWHHFIGYLSLRGIRVFSPWLSFTTTE